MMKMAQVQFEMENSQAWQSFWSSLVIRLLGEQPNIFGPSDLTPPPLPPTYDCNSARFSWGNYNLKRKLQGLFKLFCVRDMSFSWCQRKGVIWSWARGFHQNILVIQKVPVSLLFRMKAARFNASLAQLIPLLSVLAAWLLLVGTIFFGVQGVLYQRRFAEKFFSIFLVLFWPVNKTKNRRSGRILSGFGYAIFSHQQKRREFLPSEDPWQHLIVAV